MRTATSPQWIIFALAISAFCIGTAEFVMAGVLPEIAQSLSISIPQAGLLMTGYALGVVISAPILTTFTTNFPKKYVLVVLMGLFVSGNIISALAPNYNILMAGRIISALCHGAFFGIGAVAAADAVTPDKKAWAITLMFSGLTIANVVGVPIGTFLGQHFGWRSMFWVIAVLGFIGMSGIMLLVPYKKTIIKTQISKELAIFKTPQVWLSLLITAFGFGGVFAAFTYIAPLLTKVSGFAPANMSWLLSIFGIGLVLGNIWGGKFADKSLKRALYILLTSLSLVLLAFVFTAHNQILAVITLFLLGVIGFAIVSPVQLQVMKYAKNAPTIASATNISAFNLGIAAGTYLGGLTIHLGFGYTSPCLAGAMMVLCALLLQIITNTMKQPN